MCNHQNKCVRKEVLFSEMRNTGKPKWRAHLVTMFYRLFLNSLYYLIEATTMLHTSDAIGDAWRRNLATRCCFFFFCWNWVQITSDLNASEVTEIGFFYLTRNRFGWKWLLWNELWHRSHLLLSPGIESPVGERQDGAVYFYGGCLFRLDIWTKHFFDRPWSGLNRVDWCQLIGMPFNFRITHGQRIYNIQCHSLSPMS